MQLPLKRLRVIPFACYDGALNMALDYYFSGIVEKGDEAILRFYGWKPWTLSLGKHQDALEIDFEALRDAGYGCVRRPTGGSAIFHADELTYSIVIPRTTTSAHHELYGFFHQRLAVALNKMGFPVYLNAVSLKENYLNKGADTFACFNRSARNEVQWQDRKVVGSAQKLYRNSILQHGSILTGPAQYDIINFLKLQPEERAEQKKLLKSKSVSLEEIKPQNVSPGEIAVALTDVLKADFDEIEYRELEEEELISSGREIQRFSVLN